MAEIGVFGVRTGCQAGWDRSRKRLRSNAFGVQERPFYKTSHRGLPPRSPADPARETALPAARSTTFPLTASAPVLETAQGISAPRPTRRVAGFTGLSKSWPAARARSTRLGVANDTGSLAPRGRRPYQLISTQKARAISNSLAPRRYLLAVAIPPRFRLRSLPASCFRAIALALSRSSLRRLDFGAREGQASEARARMKKYARN